MAKRWGINRVKLFTYAKEGAYEAVYGKGGAFEKLTDPDRTEADTRNFVAKLADLDAISALLDAEKARVEADKKHQKAAKESGKK